MAVLVEADFKGHIMIVGSTGAGKSNLLLYFMQYLASRGATIISIDPHGDLALEQKGTIPQTQVFDPSEIAEALESTWYRADIESAASMYNPPELIEVAVNKHLVFVNRLAVSVVPLFGKNALLLFYHAP